MLKIKDILWAILEDGERFWEIVGDFEIFWDILGNSGKFWEILRDSGEQVKSYLDRNVFNSPNSW